MENATVAGWRLASALRSTVENQNRDQPRYWTSKPHSLISTTNVSLVKIGSGVDVYKSILPEIQEAQYEVILVTCFWARSATLDALNECLKALSSKANSRKTKIRVRICFSSLSLAQKLFHTRSQEGHIYPPSCWVKKFGLPDPALLTGIDLEIKSIFVLPFSVMHPKFIIVDRRVVFLPSCNVSWETWFEGCVRLTGSLTTQFLSFYNDFWVSSQWGTVDEQSSIQPSHDDRSLRSEALFLPSPHHALSLLDSIRRPTSPPTPLNIFTIKALNKAQHTIYIQTPNLTARPVLDAVLSAVSRGVNVRIVTSEKLMVLEQLVTARTTTARCVRWLSKRYTKLAKAQQDRAVNDHGEDGMIDSVGQLDIGFYTPRLDLRPDDPVQTHLKLTVIDDEIVLLGSGNMDRASWVTSQELGVAVISKDFAALIKGEVLAALDGRLTRASA